MALLVAVGAVLVPATGAGAATLGGVSWSVSSTATGAAGVTYSYAFSLATSGRLSSVTMSVPATTGGSPTLDASSVYSSSQGVITLGSPTVTLAGTTLTVSFSSQYMPAGTEWSLAVGGLANSGTAGAYTATVTTLNHGAQVDSATSGTVSLTTSTLGDPFWAASSTEAGATGVTYTYGATTTTSASLSSIVVGVPGGTTGTPALGSVSPASLSGGTLALSGTDLTYSFPATALGTGTRIQLSVTGLTNTGQVAGYGSEIATFSGATPLESAALSVMTFTATALHSLSWSASSTTAGATGVAYTYGFTTTTALQLSSITMGVAPGTGGTPGVGTVTVNPSYVQLSSPSVTLSGGLLTFSFTPTYVPAAAVISIEITGLTNTAVAGSYPAPIATFTNVTYRQAQVDSGVAPAVTFTSNALASLSWSVSSSAVSATSVTYTLSFSLSATSTLGAISMSLPPGTGGTPTLTSASPAAIGGGSLALSGQTLTYALSSPTSVSPSSTVTLVVAGMTNTATQASYASTVDVSDGATVVASGTTPPVSFTATVLTGLSWGASSTATSASGIAYTYAFTTASSSTLSSVTLTVPSGTGGTAGIGALSVQAPYGPITLGATSVSLSLTTLTLSFAATYVPANSVWSLEVGGLTNTSSAGTYTSSITTQNGSAAVDSGSTPSLSFSSSTLGNPTWKVSTTATGSTGATYTYGFVAETDATIDAITMTVPTGTGGTPKVGTVTPATVTGGTLTLSGTTLTYSLPSATSLPLNTTVSIAVDGLTNTRTAGSYTSTLTVSDQGTAQASGTTPGVTFTATVLTGLSWSASSTHTATSGVTYTYGFTTASTATLDQVTMSVPSGTGGTPGVGAVTPSGLAGGTVTLSGTILAYSFPATYVQGGTAVSVALTNMTNPSNPGTSTSVVATKNSGATVDSGTTSPVTFVGGTLGATTWSTTSTEAGSSATYTYSFTTASTSALTSVTMSVPATTAGTPSVGTVTPSSLAGGTVTLSGTTLTYSFTQATVPAGTGVSLELHGVTNTTDLGPAASTVTTFNGASTIDTGTSNSLTFTAPQAPYLTFSGTCLAGSTTCSQNAGGATHLELLALPNGALQSGSVQLSVKTNAASGYRVRAQMGALKTPGGTVLPSAPTSGSATGPRDAFYASATLAPGGASGAALCSPYGSSTPYVGYGASAQSLWVATAPTGATPDVLTLTSALALDRLQPAGVYSGTISYSVQPASGTPPTC